MKLKINKNALAWWAVGWYLGGVIVTIIVGATNMVGHSPHEHTPWSVVWPLLTIWFGPYVLALVTWAIVAPIRAGRQRVLAALKAALPVTVERKPPPSSAVERQRFDAAHNELVAAYAAGHLSLADFEEKIAKLLDSHSLIG